MLKYDLLSQGGVVGYVCWELRVMGDVSRLISENSTMYTVCTAPPSSLFLVLTDLQMKNTAFCIR